MSFWARLKNTKKPKPHINTLLCTPSCCCPMGWLLFREVGRFLTCWLRKAFPVGLNVEKTLCCQSHMPANHLTTTVSHWKSMAKKIVQTFFLSGEKSHSQYHREHLVLPFSLEVSIQGKLFVVGNTPIIQDGFFVVVVVSFKFDLENKESLPCMQRWLIT